VIRVEGVSKSFGGVPVLSDVSFEVPTGGTLALVGPGGAGKSLILKLVCGLLKPDAGRVFIDDAEVSALGETALMPIRGRIGMIFQNYALFDYMNVGTNVGFPLAQLGTVPADEVRARVERRLADVNLPGIEHLMPRELSGGMKKRVCLARATIHEPPIMLCDDPTAGLDPVSTNRIFRLLKRLQQDNGATALIVSHEVDSLHALCDEVVMLSRGRVVHRGGWDAVTNDEARQFLTGEGVT
jgi:phospholipid/cholesterol/gamma-HCH transport system ATP-binding protein